MTDSILTSSLLRQLALIDGEWTESNDGNIIEVVNPATGASIARVPKMGRDEAITAIKAAERAFKPWATLVTKQRADILLKWHQLIVDNSEELARILTTEQGKPLTDARIEVAYASSFVRFYAEEARRTLGEIIPPHRADTRILVNKQPIGVVACITPWNFPSAMITRKVAPALAAGCTVVVKPSELTPLSALALAALAVEAGVPRGAFNVVTGDAPSIGAAMCESNIVRKLSFTGSTPVGKMLAAACAPTVKKLGLELGGNAPFIVFDDANLQLALDGAMLAKFRHSGQTCVTANRFLVQRAVYDDFVARFAERVAKLRVGPGLEPGVEIGPLINTKAVAKVRAHVEDALARGAKLMLGGGVHQLGERYFQPTVLRDVNTTMLVCHEETFGPLAAFVPFDTEEEAVRIANDTPFGLAAYFYTRNMARAFRVADAIESGMVGVNSAFLSVEIAPFGGVKESGIGREGSHHGLDEFLELKYVSLGLG